MATLIPIPLQDSPYYEQAADIQGASFILRFRWNGREMSYLLDLLEQNGRPIVLGQKIVPRHSILGRYDLTEFGLTGSFGLLPAFDGNIEITKYGDVAQYYRFFYIYDE